MFSVISEATAVIFLHGIKQAVFVIVKQRIYDDLVSEYLYSVLFRSQGPRGLRRESTVRLLGLCFRIPPGHECLSLVSVVCCQVEVSATGWSLFQRIPTECGVSECDGKASRIGRPWTTMGCCATGKKLFVSIPVIKIPS
jgi:hypothetical protein